jgi:hypothetical protein
VENEIRLKLGKDNMKPSGPMKKDRQAHDYLASNLWLIRDPSLRASAQDDSHFSGGGREKKAAQPPSFPLFFPRDGMSS